MVDIIRCKEQLANLYTQQPTLENYLSKLTRQARGEQKADCLQAFGTIQDVQHFLLHPEDITLVPDTPKDQPSEQQPIKDVPTHEITPPIEEQKQPTDQPATDQPSEETQQEQPTAEEHTAAPSDTTQQTGYVAHIERSWDAMIATPFGEYVVMAGYIVV